MFYPDLIIQFKEKNIYKLTVSCYDATCDANLSACVHSYVVDNSQNCQSRKTNITVMHLVAIQPDVAGSNPGHHPRGIICHLDGVLVRVRYPRLSLLFVVLGCQLIFSPDHGILSHCDPSIVMAGATCNGCFMLVVNEGSIENPWHSLQFGWLAADQAANHTFETAAPNLCPDLMPLARLQRTAKI